MAETWIEITESVAKQKFAGPEWDSFENSATVPGVTSVVPGCIQSVVGRIRGAVRASGMHTLGPEGFVPPEFEWIVWVLLRYELAARVPGSGIVFDEVRQGQLNDARETLQRLEAGKIENVTPPEGEDPTGAVDEGAYGGECQINFSSGCYGCGGDEYNERHNRLCF